MSVFDKFMIDIYSNKDFLDYFIYKGIQYDCIVSKIVAQQITFSDSGIQSGQNFTLDVKLPVFDKFKTNQKIIFKNKQYKIAYTQIDSANASMKIYLIAMSKAI